LGRLPARRKISADFALRLPPSHFLVAGCRVEKAMASSFLRTSRISDRKIVASPQYIGKIPIAPHSRVLRCQYSRRRKTKYENLVMAHRNVAADTLGKSIASEQEWVKPAERAVVHNPASLVQRNMKSHVLVAVHHIARL
jgi:uncharacterized lipoprotein NlpE involved in copper resistance